MTRLEFEKSRLAIEQEPFEGDSFEPITYARDRNVFLCQKYQRLIDLAKKTKGMSAINKLKQWQRQLERTAAAKDRFEKLRAEIKIVRPSLFAAVRNE
jgi:hypothetical protein